MRALEEHFSRYAHASDLQLVFMVSRNSIQLLNINTTKFQAQREAAIEPVYLYI